MSLGLQFLLKVFTLIYFSIISSGFELYQPKTRNISANEGELVIFQCAVDEYFKSCTFKHNKNNKKCEIEWSQLKNCEGRNFAMKRFNRWEITHKTNFFCELKVITFPSRNHPMNPICIMVDFQ